MGTQITDTGARAVLALRSMEANAFRLGQVTTRLLDEHTGLPELLDVRPYADATRAALDLQPRTVDDARLWAVALGVELVVTDVENDMPGWHTRRSIGKTTVDGVMVFVVSSESFTAQEWAELQAAEAVAA